jgi:hypothetical protein
MTREELITTSRESGLEYYGLGKDRERFIAHITRFAELVFRQGRQEGMKQEPVDFASLLREAEEIVQSKPTWKRFIDGTPLANDIAVWMAVFAQDVARRTSPPQRQPDERNFCQRCGKRLADLTTIHTCTPPAQA